MEKYFPNYQCENTGYFHMGESSYRYTLDQHTLLYKEPGNISSVIDTIPPFSDITIIREGIDSLSQNRWFEISDYQTNKIHSKRVIRKGYIKNENLSLGNANNTLLGKSSEIDTVYGKPSPKFRLYSYKKNKNEVLDIFDINLSGIDYYNQFYYQPVYSVALKDIHLSELHWHDGESHPESNGEIFFSTSSDGKITELIRSSGSGTLGWSDYTHVYFPVRFNDGKILLVENGNPYKMFNWWDRTFNTYDYPKDCEIPIEQLVVLVEKEIEFVRDYEKGGYVLDKNGKEIEQTIHHIIRYYQWDGKKLNLTKENIIVKRPTYE